MASALLVLDFFCFSNSVDVVVVAAGAAAAPVFELLSACLLSEVLVEDDDAAARFSDWRKVLTKLSKVLLPVRKVTWWPLGRAGPKKLLMLMAEVESARFRPG